MKRTQYSSRERGKGILYKPPRKLEKKLESICYITKWTKTAIIDKCLEAMLDALLEKKEEEISPRKVTFEAELYL